MDPNPRSTIERAPEEGIKMDSYIKGVLTVIAAALIMLVIQNFIPNAKAQLHNSGCGLTERTPCYIATSPRGRWK
jgi:hypothetical protein